MGVGFNLHDQFERLQNLLDEGKIWVNADLEDVMGGEGLRLIKGVSSGLTFQVVLGNLCVKVYYVIQISY